MVKFEGKEIKIRDMTPEQRKAYNSGTQARFRAKSRASMGELRYMREETLRRKIRLHDMKSKQLREELAQLLNEEE